jgi:hypothetical protein
VKVPVRIPLALIEHDLVEKSEGGEGGDSEISPGHVAVSALVR